MTRKRMIAMATVSITSHAASPRPARFADAVRRGAGGVSVAGGTGGGSPDVCVDRTPSGGMGNARASRHGGRQAGKPAITVIKSPRGLVDDGLLILRDGLLLVLALILDGGLEVLHGLADRAAEAAEFARAEDDQDDDEDDD